MQILYIRHPWRDICIFEKPQPARPCAGVRKLKKSMIFKQSLLTPLSRRPRGYPAQAKAK